MQAARQDETFWHQAYREHGGAVLAYLRGRYRRQEEAEDLLQETFVRAIRAGSFRPGGNLRGYLLSVARNLILNRLRRPRLVLPAQGGEGESGELEGLASEAASPEQEARWRDFGRDLERTLVAMSPAHARAFRLAVIEQLSYREIAEKTGWSMAQVKVNLFRARRKATEELSHHLEGRDRAAGEPRTRKGEVK